MLRGTRFLIGDDAVQYNIAIEKLRLCMLAASYSEIILPVLWEQQTFIDKAGSEILGQMWAFKDKGDRHVCLIPEATAVIQELYNTKKISDGKYFYITRCYRYERPQLGRYREFTQFGVEFLGGNEGDKEETVGLLRKCLSLFEIEYDLILSVKRGLSYYTEDGFEAVCNSLGAQKQIAGGGRYKEGIGWAIGLERLLLAEKTP